MNSYKSYRNRGHKFIVPSEIEKRSNEYFEMNDILEVFINENYEIENNTNDKNKKINILKLKDFTNHFYESTYYNNLNKLEKRKHNKQYIIKHFKENTKYNGYYKESLTDNKNNKSYTNILLHYKQKEDNDNDDDDNNKQDYEKNINFFK